MSSMQRQEIPIEIIGDTLQQLVKACKAGDPAIESIRCAYTIKDDPLIYMYNVFDLIDNLVKNPLDLNTVEKFYVYRPLNKS